MNREQKSVAIAEIAGHIDESEAIFAVDYRGITVAEIAELRAKLRDADATFTVVKNSLTERAADHAGAEPLKEFLTGPTALTFVRGDVAMAAKAVADYGRATQLLPFKGGFMEGGTLEVEQIRALSRLPSREALYGQLVGVVASPIGGLVRSLGGLLGGLAVALGQVREKKESGEVPAGDAPPSAEADAPATEEASAPEVTEAAPAEEAVEAAAGTEEAPAEAPAEAAAEPQADNQTEDEAQPAAEAESEQQTEPEADASEQQDENKADVSAESEPEDAETSSTKED